MKITFIRPSIGGLKVSSMPPLAFAILKALTPPDIETVLYDEQVEAIPFEEDSDLAAITVETYTARRAYQIATHYRKRGIPVVVGGYHPSVLPEEAAHFADAVVIGEAEGTWEQVLADLGKGRLQTFYQCDTPAGLTGLTMDRSLFASKPYSPLSPVQFGRGCKYDCEFCSIHLLHSGKPRQRPIPEVIADIQALKRRYIFFTDDNLFNSSAQAEALFRALIPLNIRWVGQISSDVTRSPELLSLMAQSGCMAVVVGFESLNPDNLAQMNKKWNIQHESVIQKFYDQGIMIMGTFVLGYDQDTPQTFDLTAEFALRSRFVLANFNPLTPTPGTRLYERLHNEERLLYDRWWLDPAYRYGHAIFSPAGMTPQELTAGCYHARTEFNRYPAIARRVFSRPNINSPRHLMIALVANLVSRTNIHLKQGHPLGGLFDDRLSLEGLK